MVHRLEDMSEVELEDWDNRHESVLRWGGTWRKLTYVFFAVALCLIFTNHSAMAWLFIGFEWLFFVADLACQRRHTKLHKEIGE